MRWRNRITRVLKRRASRSSRFRRKVGSECRLSAAADYRVEKQMTFVDEIGLERKPRKLRAANADVVSRFLLEPPNSFKVEALLDVGVAVIAPVSVRHYTSHRNTARW